MVNKLALILVSGPPGAGKSTLACALSKKLRVTLLDKDSIDEPFSPDDRGDGYSSEIEPKSLAALVNLAELNLKNHNGVILDAPWTHLFINSPSIARDIRRLAKSTKAKLLILECVISEKTLRTRLKRRGYKRDMPRLTKAGWENFKVTDKLGKPNPLPHHKVDLEQGPKKVLRLALKLLDG